MLIYFFDLKRVSQPLNEYSQLEEMLALRKLGWSYLRLAEHFNVPKTTIRYLCRKFGLMGKLNPPIARSRTTSKPKVMSYDEEDINPGKSYAEYLQDERDRKWKRLTQSHLK